MSWFNDTAKSLTGATRVIMHDQDGLSDFNNTVTGFWRSFSAIILIAPLYLFISSINWDADTATATAGKFSPARQLFILGLQWTIWPVVMVFASRWAGLGKHYSRYVIAYNWSNVLLITILAIPALLFRLGAVSLEVAGAFIGMLQLITFYLEWYIARLSLDTKGLVAAAIVLGNFVLSVGILRVIG